MPSHRARNWGWWGRKESALLGGLRHREHLAHQRHDFRAVKFDRAHPLAVRQRAGAVFEIEAYNPKRLGGCDDLARDGLRRAHIERAAFDFLLELSVRDRRPAAFAAD